MAHLRALLRALLMMLAVVVATLPPGGVVLASPDNRLQLSGFASFGAGKINHSDLPFLNYTDSWSFRSDSVVGGQAQYQFSNRVSATAQVVARGFTFDDNDKFDPVLEWLFASYQVSSESRFRLGRMRTPLYLFSDSLEIGYSYPWIRPPVDIYSYLLSPLSSFDGADFSTTVDLGNADLDIQWFVGNTDGMYIDFDIEVSPILGANVISRWDNLTLRYGITLADTDAYSESLSNFASKYSFFTAVDPIFAEIRESHQTESEWFQYHSVGLQWDYERWSVISEAYAINGPDKNFANDAKGWYVSLSKQIQNFSPYIVLGYYKNEFSDDIAERIEASKRKVAEGLNADLDALRAFNLRLVDDFNEKGKSYTIGIRYDFHARASFKFEVEYFNSTAQLTRTTEQHSQDDTVLTSMVVDVVF